jgi:hypothetical protein
LRARASSRASRSTEAPTAKLLSITDGRTTLGTVELINGAFVAVVSTDEIVGSFDTLAAAARSLPARESAR